MSASMVLDAAVETQPDSSGRQILGQAFASFNEVADSLERSYAQLQNEVERLRRELESSNRNLSRCLEDNQTMRRHLDRILNALPCGVLVTGANGKISL